MFRKSISRRVLERILTKKSQRKAQKKPRKSPETTRKLPGNYPETTREKLLNLIASNPGLTRKELAELLGITSDGVKYHIQKLTDENIIKREGSDRAGKWVIL